MIPSHKNGLRIESSLIKRLLESIYFIWNMLRILSEYLVVYSPSLKRPISLLSSCKCYDLSNIRVGHEGYDPEIYKPPTFFQKRTSNIFTFGSCGKFEVRKSTPEIIQAYLRAANKSPYPSKLLLHCFDPFQPHQQTLRKIADILQAEKVLFSFDQHEIFSPETSPGRHQWQICIPNHRMNTLEQLRDEVYYVSDMFLFPSRGEGWGLPLMEALACGIPAICTTISAMSEYIKENYPDVLKLQDTKLDVVYDPYWFKEKIESRLWYTINVDELESKISWALNHQEEVKQLGPICRESIKDFTLENAAKQLEKILQC